MQKTEAGLVQRADFFDTATRCHEIRYRLAQKDQVVITVGGRFPQGAYMTMTRYDNPGFECGHGLKGADPASAVGGGENIQHSLYINNITGKYNALLW